MEVSDSQPGLLIRQDGRILRRRHGPASWCWSSSASWSSWCCAAGGTGAEAAGDAGAGHGLRPGAGPRLRQPLRQVPHLRGRRRQDAARPGTACARSPGPAATAARWRGSRSSRTRSCPPGARQRLGLDAPQGMVPGQPGYYPPQGGGVGGLLTGMMLGSMLGGGAARAGTMTAAGAAAGRRPSGPATMGRRAAAGTGTTPARGDSGGGDTGAVNSKPFSSAGDS